MLFNSLKFLIFFPAVVLLYFVLPKRVRNLWLLVASYVFYMGWNAKYVVLLFTSTLITYLSGLLLERVKDSDRPETKKTALKKWVVAVSFLLNLGIKEENLRLRDHDAEELCFYSKATTDFEYRFAFGWGELWGVADRTNYDLTQHMNHSGKSMEYFDPEENRKYIPYVIEPSLGVERLFLSIVTEAYDEEVVDAEKNDTRVVMHFHPALAPYKAAILPLSKKLSAKAQEVYAQLSKKFMIDFDDTGSIGKRYRRQDEIGTPFCITYDFDTLEKDNCVTVRNRDTMEQVRIPIADLEAYLSEKVAL